MKRILIVENDIQLARMLKEAVTAIVSEVAVAASISEAFSFLDLKNYDLVLLDRVLDDGDGMEIAEYLHDLSFNTKIIVLSTLGDTDNRVRGLQNGADLYLPKPFNQTELLTMISKMLDLEKIKKTETIKLGPLSFSDQTGVVSSDGYSCHLRRKEAEILQILIVRKNQVVTRDQIIEGVWGSRTEIPTYSTIDAYIRKIRVALKDYSSHIKTVRGFGYSAMDQI